MRNRIKNQTESTVYQKVIFVIIACSIALGFATVISKTAFDEMLNKVNKISTPNEKMRLVSRISRDILQIDQLQRNQLLNNKSYSNFTKRSDFILESLDTLKGLYSINSIQVKRIDSIRILLNERNKLFSSYLKGRKNLVDNQAFSDQIKNITSLIQNTPERDSTVITTEKKTTSRTIKEDNRGFFAKLFGIKSKPENSKSSAPQTVREELNVQVDSIQNIRKEKTEAEIDKAIQNLEVGQKQKSSTFINHEAELTIAGSILVSNMFNILHEVENEAMQQVEIENTEARSVVNQSVQRIVAILLFFFFVSIVLIYFILSDIRKNTAYRIALEDAKSEAEYHSDAKQRFLSNMSHELRTPLQSIIGYAEQLQHANKDEEKINVIYQSSEHLLQIVNEILDYNQINSGKFNFQKENINLQTLAEEVVTVMNPQAKKKDIKLILSTRISGKGLVIGDAFRLKQILFNLVGNAIKFTSEGEVLLQISATDYPDKTDISYRIQDSGPGIQKEDIEKIFDEFEQSTHTDSGSNFGNGLGLTIVKTLVEAMNGNIKVKSVQGKGSVFTIDFSLPPSTDVQTNQITDSLLKPISTFRNTVWLIDDDSFILDLCQNILSKYNIAHQSFHSPIDCLNQPFNPELSHILTDIRMPGMDGKKLYKRLRGVYGDTVKIIAFTAQALPEERKEILALGFDDLLLKPFKEADLLATLGLAIRSDSFQMNSEHIFNIFKKDTQNDLKLLYESVLSNDYNQSELLIHRMGGRIAQLGENKIAFKLRKMEIDTRNGDLPTTSQIQEIEKQLKQFIFTIDEREVS